MMKQKLTTLLFGLLLAVGWTSNALAQSATYTAESIKDLTYTWQDANGATQTSPYVQFNEEKGIYESVLVTNPYQIYGLLRGVYMEKALPGPTYTSYSNNDQRERQVYYGGIAGGWNIPGSATINPVGNITITTTRSGNQGNRRYINIHSILVYDNNNGNELVNWVAPSNAPATSLTNAGLTYNGTPTVGSSGGTSYIYLANATGTITIPSSKLNGATSVRVVINARYSNTGPTLSYTVDGTTTTQAVTNTFADYTWEIIGTSTNDENFYTPNEEGYTAVMVAVNNTTVTKPYDYYNSYDRNNAMSTFGSKAEIIQYFTDNVASVKLLTDGLRIGSGYDEGTVFNCDGTYNKFFILGKGQSRQKDSQVITLENTYGLMGENVPFKEMFEQFSPTSGESGSQITDFYNEMMKGSVYSVVHDCASVIHNGHQFSMSGNTGTEAKSFTGLNFFIPDYRLKYWETTYDYKYTIWGTQYTDTYTVDGRTMNPYIGRRNGTTTEFRDVPSYCSNFAQYNQAHAPKIGLYLITLSADAEKVAGYSETNRYYDINLDWTSSLNEMAGEEVPQKYVVYEVLYDENGKEYLDSLTTVPNLTEWSIKNFPQPEHSVTRTFIIKGWPTDSDHPSFIAWSNRDQVVIPGYNDFLALALNHYESDFVVNEEKNYYRNFLTVSNENEENALTVERITNGESNYTLFRYDMAKPGVQIPVADLGFQIQGNPETAKYVQFTVSYGSYGSQDQLHPTGQPSKYDLTSMGVLTTGDLCLHGNGDLIIQPSSPTVNFHSIEVKNGNGAVITRWTESNGTTLPNGWKVSPGSTFELFDGVYYLEGHGYIYIPASVLGNNTGINVTINASADASSVSRITVNDESKKINNGEAEDYVWTAQEVAHQLFDDGMVRMGGLPIVDQFTASTAKNDHPNRYGYVLKYKPGEEGEKTSGTVEVPVQKTGSVVTGYYTLDQLDKDTDRALTTDILTAEVQMSLSDINSSIYHYTLLGADKNKMPVNDAAHTNYISYLQQRQDFTYREMLTTSPLYVEDNTFGYPAGPLNYYNEAEKTKGAYGDYKAYVPMVETTGYERRWYEVQNNQYGDYLHNTYGAPIWKTGVGEIAELQVKAERQTGKDGSTNWNDGTDDCSLYILSDVNVTAHMPSNSNVEYEPYMFRIFVESPSGKLRGYKQVAAGEGDPAGEHLEADALDNPNGPICIYTEYVDGSYDENGNFVIGSDKIEMDGTTVTFDMTKNANNWADNAVFGAVDAIIKGTGDNLTIDENDLKIYVRFYYVAKGAALGHTPDNRLRAGGNEGHVGNASEGSTTPSGKTAVYELVINGEVVGKTYINAIGQQSDKPFKGVNIVITRYSDGTVTTTKIVK